MSNIKAGDFVMIVKPMACCVEKTKFGVPFKVSEVSLATSRCPWCGEISDPIPHAFNEAGQAVELYRLKKIDPPSTEDQITREVEVTA